jgi:hypothetical protein
MSFDLFFVVTGVIVGLLTGGSLRNLADLSLRRFWLLGLSILLRFPLMFSESFSLGTVLTLTAIVANGGYMPGSNEMYLALLKRYGLMERAAAFEAGLMNYHTTALTSETRLWFLTDVIPIPRITVTPFVVSIGDVLVGIGMFLVVLWGMRTRARCWPEEANDAPA